MIDDDKNDDYHLFSSSPSLSLSFLVILQKMIAIDEVMMESTKKNNFILNGNHNDNDNDENESYE